MIILLYISEFGEMKNVGKGTVARCSKNDIGQKVAYAYIRERNCKRQLTWPTSVVAYVEYRFDEKEDPEFIELDENI